MMRQVCMASGLPRLHRTFLPRAYWAYKLPLRAQHCVNPMNRLLDIGFQVAGHWFLKDGALHVAIRQYGEQRNILYAFVCDGYVKYVGKSTQTFRKRMAGYLSPGPTSTTNIRNNKRIRELLAKDVAVDVYVLPDNGLMRYGAFHLNLAAGLEDSIIAELAPEWNFHVQRLPEAYREREITDKEPMTEPSQDELETAASEPEATGSFEFRLQPTYWNQGFFNGGVASTALLGADGDTIEIFYGDEAQAVLGTINRTATGNGSPRVFGGPALRGRFQTLPQMTPMVVEVLSPTSIRIRAATREPAL